MRGLLILLGRLLSKPYPWLAIFLAVVYIILPPEARPEMLMPLGVLVFALLFSSVCMGEWPWE